MILVKSQNLKYLAAVIFGLSTISIAAFAIFNQKGGSHAGKIAHKKPQVEDNGRIINFFEESPALGLLKSQKVMSASSVISMTAPARVVAATTSKSSDGQNKLLFESSDLASIFSDFEQGLVSHDRASRNLKRTREMFDTQAATAKDLSDAEHDVATARALLNASDGKLRAVGLNPTDLVNTNKPTAWLISDVPESQMKEVEKGESVNAQFSAYPNDMIQGQVDAIGDTVDSVLRSVKVRVKLPNPTNKLRPGMFAKVDFGAIHDSVIKISTGAVVTVEGQTYAFIKLSEGKFERRQITLIDGGSDKDVLILSGIKEGDEVVYDGAMLLKGISFGF